ncbi:MAG: tetratricopeptide repeat protein [Candidatus Omnitrophica bacterium]|nr:tetratricopeptide repeat protein [Candidatus Omnitrophota bacterium]
MDIRSRENVLVVLLLLAATVVCYSAALDSGFVWDDRYIVTDNALLRAPLWSLQPFKQDIVNSSFTYTVYYRPLQILSYAVDSRIWGMEAYGFHLSNMMLHFLNAVLVFLFALKISGHRASSALASILFTVNPASIGSVAYISGRSDLLYLFFGLLFLIMYIRYRETGERVYILSGALMLAGSVFSKEAAVIFPFIFLALDSILLRRREGGRTVPHLVSFGIVGVYSLLHWIFLGRHYPAFRFAAGAGTESPILRFLSEFAVMGLVPAGSGLRMTGPEVNGIVVLSVIAVGAAVTLYLLRDKRRILSFLLVFYLLSMVPFFFARAMAGLGAAHWTYLSGAGIFLFISLALSGLFEKGSKPLKVTAVVLTGGLISCCATATITDTGYWKNDVTLSDRVLDSSPEDTTALHFKAFSLLNKDRNIRPAKALRQVKSAKIITPRGHYLRGRVYLAAGEVDEAVKEFETAARIDPGYENAYVGMAMSEFMKERPDSGIRYLRRALEINPGHPEALRLLYIAYSGKEEYKKALTVAQRAWREDPYGYDSLVNLADVLLSLGAVQESAKLYLEAAELYPERPVPAYKLGYIFYRSWKDGSGGKMSLRESRKWLYEAVRTEPGYMPARRLIKKIEAP